MYIDVFFVYIQYEIKIIITKRIFQKFIVWMQVNVKDTWKAINSVLKRKKQQNKIPNEFNYHGKSINSETEIVNHFNEYFINVGHTWANLISHINNVDHIYFMCSRLKDSMYIQPVTESDILDIVYRFRSKKSKGYDDINMSAVKTIIHYTI